jgi:DNA-directed RNA polymerase specialized sigma24 family protein
MKAPQRARRSTACPAATTKIKKRPKPPKANKRGRFETLVRRYYSGVYNFASRLTDDPVEAVVLTHLAFISTRRQLRSRRNEVDIVTILLTAVIRAAGIAKLEGANRTTRVHANKVTEWNRAHRQACSRLCPICLEAERARAVKQRETNRTVAAIMDSPQLLVALGGSSTSGSSTSSDSSLS